MRRLISWFAVGDVNDWSSQALSRKWKYVVSLKMVPSPFHHISPELIIKMREVQLLLYMNARCYLTALFNY